MPVLDPAYLSSLLESYLIGQYDLILYSSFCYAWIIFFSILSSFISKPCVNHISWWLDTQNFGYPSVRLSNFLWVCEGKYFFLWLKHLWVHVWTGPKVYNFKLSFFFDWGLPLFWKQFLCDKRLLTTNILCLCLAQNLCYKFWLGNDTSNQITTS